MSKNRANLKTRIKRCEAILADKTGAYEPETVASAIERHAALTRIKNLWAEFEDVPMNPETEEIDADWHGFPAGTHREDIWHWFETEFKISVAEDLMYE